MRSLTADHYCFGVPVPGVFRVIMGCSRGVPGLFRPVPGCSGGVPGMFRGVPGFTDTQKTSMERNSIKTAIS